MTNEQLLDSVGVMVRLALEAGNAPADVLTVVQEACKRFGQLGCSDAVVKVAEIIDRDFAQKLTLDGLAKEAFLSKTYLCQLFSREMKMPLSTYINKVRIEKSKAMLHNNSLTLIAVAKRCGFADGGYYCRIFKKFEGVSPKLFRERMIAEHRNRTS